ncbi:hypothetical protein PF010_g2912 [Phytophthora fragariae]|uniref:Uncharacterized protein n=1 Tax=Phytophthora fragariae TaxID=53985 RepID=A0A6A3K9L3_9STRA|nr:hypothetical protein PF011_g12492 [Phytophthora fragariae]KAE9133155.1 hypothetical protein PF010_g2912 [Phytophthora fragariae]KAE9237990.1 hypothetical protein PF004_g8438 [Phytophthora fragariae]KAE9330898.1 hypothetical protein PF008_g15627 [Phytophthora fragariae]
MSTPTTQTSNAPAASAAANAVVANTATTATSLASSASVVTYTVTTLSPPKSTIAIGEYHKTRGKVTYARESLFDGSENADMEEGEDERESSSSGRDEASVGTRRPREDDSDASVQSARVAAATGRLLMPELCLPRGVETTTTPLRLRL